MDVKVFSNYKDQDNFVINWGECPDYFIKWLVKEFANGQLDYNKHKLDVSSAEFNRFFESFQSKIYPHTIAHFFGINVNDVDRLDERFFCNVNKDIFNACKRRIITLSSDDTFNGNIKFQFSNDVNNMSKAICKEGIFNGKVVHIHKECIDHGFGRMERWLHECDYFLNLSLRIYGIPLVHDTINLDIRPEFLKKYNCQRVTKHKLEDFERKNTGKGKGKITMQLRYMESNDGWKWDFAIVDKKQIIEQLEF